MISRIKKSKNLRILIRILISLISTVLVFLLFETKWFYSLELNSINLRFSFRGERETKDPIIIIGIDDNSIEELGNFPWDRVIYKNLLQRLGENPKIIAFDIYFDVKSNPKSDQVFSELLRQDKRIIIAAFYTITDDPRYGALKRLFLPLDIFSKNTKVGLINPEYDNDGFIRRFSLKSKIFEKEWISFPLLVVSEYIGISPQDYLEHTQIPTDSDSKVFINYRGGPLKYPYFSFVDVLNGNVDTRVFK
ncbi:MAG: CHASE2 domain-containing protein, partial [Dictyoglomus sp.]